MSNDISYTKKPGNGKVIAGLILLLFGGALLFQQLDFFFIPNWLFRWPVILIVIGLYSGAKHNFRNSGWLVMILVGMVWLLNTALPGYDVGRVTWPVGIIVFGLWMILRRGNRFDKNK